MSSNLDWSFQDYLSENVRFDDFVDYGAYAGTSEDLGELFEASSLDVVYPQGGLSAVGSVDAWKTQSISEPQLNRASILSVDPSSTSSHSEWVFFFRLALRGRVRHF